MGASTHFPVSDGPDYDDFTALGGGAKYAEVDEESADDETSYVSSVGANRSQVFGITSPAVPAGATNIKVTVITRMRKVTSGTSSLYPSLNKTGNTYGERRDSWGGIAPTTSYADYTTELTLDPWTSAAWTVAEVNKLNRVGFGQSAVSGSEGHRITRMVVVVSWDGGDAGTPLPVFMNQYRQRR